MNKLLKDLRKLKDVYYDTEKCQLGKDLNVVLKLLTSEEETDVHDFASKHEQGIAYLYSVKRETLSRSIIELNGNKIPEVIEEVDNDKNIEKVQKHIWLRDNVVKGWNQVLIDEIWNKYAKLLIRMEQKIVTEVQEDTPPKE